MSVSRILAGFRQRLWRSSSGRGKASSAASETTVGPEHPNGFLFNEKPLLPGEKRQKEPWENIWVYSMTFNFLLIIAICTLKPDTSVSGWSKQKALERLAERENAKEQSGEDNA